MRKTFWFAIMLLSVLLLFGGSGAYAAQSAGGVVDDSVITTSVKAELAKDVRLGTLTGIEVNTTKGVVTLAGKVRNAEEKLLAEKVAKSIDGVQKVNNNLQVVP